MIERDRRFWTATKVMARHEYDVREYFILAFDDELINDAPTKPAK